MEQWRKKGSVIIVFFLLLASFILQADSMEAATYTGQERPFTLLASKVGRYQFNYTGNTNHYAYWNNTGTATLENRIYQDVGGSYANSSTAELKKTVGAESIQYAFLIWETRAEAGATTPVYFISPDGKGTYVSPTYAVNDLRNPWGIKALYCMAADVTEIVNNGGYGNYSVCNIPRWSKGGAGGESPGSWQLLVVEEGDDFPVRAVSLIMSSEFRLAENYACSMPFAKGLKSKTKGNATGQIFFGASNSGSNAPMTEQVATYDSSGKIVGQAVSNTTYRAGLYRNGTLVNSRDYNKGCIRMDLSEVSNIGNNASSIRLDVQNKNYTSFFLLGIAIDIAYPEFAGTQTTQVSNGNKVVVEGTFTNQADTINTGIYKGRLVVELDHALTPLSAAAMVNGKVTLGVIQDNTVIFDGSSVASMMNGDSISYTVQCVLNSTTGDFLKNKAGFHGYLRADGVNTDYWIERMWTAASSAEKPKYTVLYDANEGEGAIAGMTLGYGENFQLQNGFYAEGWTFSHYVVIRASDGKVYCKDESWNTVEETEPDDWYVFYVNEEVYCMDEKWLNMEHAENDIFTFYAQWEAEYYTVTLEKGTGVQVVAGAGEYAYGADVEISAVLLEGYHWLGWTGTYDTEEITLQFSMPAHDVEMEANGEPNCYTIVFDANGGKGEGLENIVTQYDAQITLPGIVMEDGRAAYQKYTRNGVNVTDEAAEAEVYSSVFKGWALEAGKESFVPQWKMGETLDSALLAAAAQVTSLDGAEIRLYAVWDDCPWIEACNLYYTLEQAQSGFITEAEILSHAEASDREDGSPIEIGFHENGTAFYIADYAPEDFTQFRHGGDCTENLTVIDSSGNSYRKQITIFIADTASLAVQPVGTIRFIDEYYYGQPSEYGGLEEKSLWKTDPEYIAVLQEAFANMKNNTPEQSFHLSHEDILEMKENFRRVYP